LPVDDHDPETYPAIFNMLLGIPEPLIENPEEQMHHSSWRRLLSEMDSMLLAGRHVFLHCDHGGHRSASIVVLYLASRGNVPFEAAWNYVHAMRPGIKPLVADRALGATGAPSALNVKPRETLMTTTFYKMYMGT
jgi:hypothetical protein